jgi:hypothetical protein
MPFVDQNPTLMRGPEGIEPPAPRPTLDDTVAAAFRQDNTVINLFRRMKEQEFPPEPDYNPINDIRDTKYLLDHSDNFVNSRSSAETRAIMRRIDGEETDRRTLAASGVAGFVAQVAAGTIDPTLALPAGVVVRGVSGGYSVIRTAMSTGLAAGVQTALQEGVLQAKQETRTAGESAVSVASATLLGGLIGAGAVGLLSRAERNALERALDADRAAMDFHVSGQPTRAAGAAATREPTTGLPVGVTQEGTAYRFPIRDAGGADVGEIKFELDALALERGPNIRILGSQIPDEVNRGKGSAVAAYQELADYALSTGRQLWSDRTVSPDAARIYEALERRGYKVERLKDQDAGRSEAEFKVVAGPQPTGTFTGGGGSVGAAAADTRQLEMFPSIPGTAFVSPTRRTMEAASVEGRRVMADLAELPYRFRENVAGVATSQGPSVERLARMEMNGTRVQISDELQRQFSDYRYGQPDKMLPGLRARVEDITGRGDGKLSYHDFKQEVAIALQNEDRHAIPQVSNAALYIRQKLLDPWAERAEQAIEGFERNVPKEGESYYPHIWNKTLIRARRPEFVNKLVDKYQTDQTAKRAAQERLRGLNDDLNSARTAVERAKTPDEAAEATLRHDAIRTRIEDELGAWEGRSASEAKSALKARQQYDAERTARAAAEGKEKPTNRLAAADDAIDRTVKRILANDYERGVDELRDRAQQTVHRILGSPDGRLPYDEHLGGPRIGISDGSPPPRGSLAQRSLDVTNAWARDWLENDVERVVALHLRTMVPDVLLAERFGDVEMSDAFRRIHGSYAKIIDQTKGEKTRTRLGKEQDAVIRDVAAVRDRIRGIFGWSPDMQNMARVANAAKNINNLTSMGVAAVSSLSDAAGTLIRYGLQTGLQDGWAPFIRSMLQGGTEEWAKFKTEMRAIGIGVETAINARQHALDDVMDVYRPHNRFERALQATSDKFFIANLLAPETDMFKLISAHVSVSNILRATKAAHDGKATRKQIGNLAESGIDQNMAGRIWQQFVGNGGDIINGVHLPNTKDWLDKAAADALNGAVARDVDIMVVTPGQEKPLWMSKPVISLLGQFKAFTASSTERILIANLQRRDAAALSGLVASLGLGILSYKLNSFFGGQKTSDRPQDWVKEGISRAGLLGWFEEGNALASKASRGSVDIYRMIGADKPLSRFVSRSAADMLLGPTWGKIEALPKLTGSAFAGDWSAADTTALRRLVAGQNLFYVRGLLNQIEQSVNSRYGIPERKEPPTRH